MIELSKIVHSRKSFIEIELPNPDGSTSVETLDFEYNPVSPLILRQLDKISSEVKNHNDNGKDAEGNTKTDFIQRSALIEQLCVLLTNIGISENGNPLVINIENLEKVNLNILDSINMKIYEERLPSKKNLTTSKDGSSEADGSEENLVG